MAFHSGAGLFAAWLGKDLAQRRVKDIGMSLAEGLGKARQEVCSTPSLALAMDAHIFPHLRSLWRHAHLSPLRGRCVPST
eukprot:5937994-Amphidinium_carterae.1